MSTYGAILGASIGVILLCLVVMVACYVLYAVSHMKALKALGYKNAWHLHGFHTVYFMHVRMQQQRGKARR